MGAAQPINSRAKKADEEEPTLFPDLYWIWESYCFLNERRQVGANGPQPISPESMLAYAKLSNRMEARYREQLIQFIPILDREFLRDFYDKQAAEMEKIKKKSERPGHRNLPKIGR